MALDRFRSKGVYKSFDEDEWIARSISELLHSQSRSLDEIREKYREIFEWAENKRSFQELL
ncbi:MAG: hypothetical protein DRN20_06105, partial [Thermoplasmata archaeon]